MINRRTRLFSVVMENKNVLRAVKLRKLLIARNICTYQTKNLLRAHKRYGAPVIPCDDNLVVSRAGLDNIRANLFFCATYVAPHNWKFVLNYFCPPAVFVTTMRKRVDNLIVALLRILKWT